MRSWSPEERVAALVGDTIECPRCEIRFRPVGEEEHCRECEHLLRLEEIEAQKVEARIRRVAEDLRGAMAAAGVPKRYTRYSRRSWEERGWKWPEGAESVLDAWAADETEEWLVFVYGLYGRRKTGLATSMLSEWLLRGRNGRWVDQNDWLREIKAGFNGTPSDAEVFDRTAQVPLLVFDDLGAVRDRTGNEWWKTVVAELFRYRYSHELPTIVTSNVSKIADLAAIDGSLVSRMDVRYKLHLQGEDYRKKEKG